MNTHCSQSPFLSNAFPSLSNSLNLPVDSCSSFISIYRRNKGTLKLSLWMYMMLPYDTVYITKVRSHKERPLHYTPTLTAIWCTYVASPLFPLLNKTSIVPTHIQAMKMVAIAIVIVIEPLGVNLQILSSLLYISCLHVSPRLLYCVFGLLLSREPVTTAEDREITFISFQ